MQGATRRVDKRGIPVPDWWQDDTDTETAQVANVNAMKTWRRR